MVFFSEALDQHVIDVHFHGFTNQISENFINKALVCCPSIFQAEQHNLIVVEAAVYSERYFIFVLEAHVYLVVTGVCVHKAK